MERTLSIITFSLIFLLIMLVVGYFAYGTLSRKSSRKEMMKGIGIKNGHVTGVDTSCADSIRLNFPLHRFLRRDVECLIICLILTVSIVASMIAKPFKNEELNIYLVGVCFILYCIHSFITSIINSPRIWFDKDGFHSRDRIPENKDFIAKDALIAVTIINVTLCLWGIYMQVFHQETFPIWPLIYLALSLAISYFLYTNREEDLTIIKKKDQLLYDRLENGFLLNDIEWKEIERIEYISHRSEYRSRLLFIPFNRIRYNSYLNVIFKNKEYNKILLELNPGFSICENLFPLYQYDHRIFIPLATLCKAHGVNFLCTAKRL